MSPQLHSLEDVLGCTCCTSFLRCFRTWASLIAANHLKPSGLSGRMATLVLRKVLAVHKFSVGICFMGTGFLHLASQRCSLYNHGRGSNQDICTSKASFRALTSLRYQRTAPTRCSQFQWCWSLWLSHWFWGRRFSVPCETDASWPFAGHLVTQFVQCCSVHRADVDNKPSRTTVSFVPMVSFHRVWAQPSCARGSSCISKRLRLCARMSSFLM